MPQALAFAGAVLFGAGLAGASTAYIIAVNIARLALISLVNKALAPKIDLQQTAADKLFTSKSAIQAQSFVYGQDMLSGPYIFAQVEEEQTLHRIVGLTGREIDSFVGFRIDDTDITIGTDIASSSATVTGGKFAGVVDIDTRLGTGTQTVFSALNTAFPSLWTSAHRGRGWSMLYTAMRFEGNNEAFESGVPQNLRALVKGHKIYDPRLDTTQTDIPGSGSHRVDDETTWEWSDNPALCLADWLLWDQVGMGEPSTRIDWELVAEAADICDELVDIPTSDTQKRYTCNFTFFADQTRSAVKEILEGAMLGRCIFSQGKWRMWAGAALTSSITLTESNLAGGIQVEAGTGSKDRYNRVRGKFVDPDRNYQAVAYPPRESSSYLADDNNEINWKTIDFNACNNAYEAQRNAIVLLRKSRSDKRIVFPGNWSCFPVQAGHVVEIDNDELGWTGEKFFITEWTLDKEGKGVTLVGVAEDDSVWADPAEGDYVTRTPTGELTSSTFNGVKISDATISNSASSTDDCESGIVLAADRQLYYLTKGGVQTTAGVPSSEWSTNFEDYWVRVTEDSGTLDVGTVSTWLPLDTDQEFSIINTTGGLETATISVEIASDAAGSNVVANATFVLEAYREVFALVDDEDDTHTSTRIDNGIHWNLNGQLLKHQGAELTAWGGSPLMFRADQPSPVSTSYVRLTTVSTEGDGAFLTSVYDLNAALWLDDGNWHAIDGTANLLWVLSTSGQSGGFTVGVEYSDDNGTTIRGSHEIRYVWEKV